MTQPIDASFRVNLTDSLRSDDRLARFTQFISPDSLQFLRNIAQTGRMIECQDLIRAGKMAGRARHYSAAIYLTSLCLTENRNDPGALIVRAAAYQCTNNIQFALDDLDQIVKSSEEERPGAKTDLDRAAENLAMKMRYQRARTYIQDGLLDRAFADLNVLITRGSLKSSPLTDMEMEAMYAAAFIHYRKNDLDSALLPLNLIIQKTHNRSSPLKDCEKKAINLNAEIALRQHNEAPSPQSMLKLESIVAQASRRLPDPFTPSEIEVLNKVNFARVETAQHYLLEGNMDLALAYLKPIMALAEKKIHPLTEEEIRAFGSAKFAYLRKQEVDMAQLVGNQLSKLKGA